MFPTFPFDLSLCSFLVPTFPAAISNVVPAPAAKQVAAVESTNVVTESLAEVYRTIATATRRRMSAMQAIPTPVASAFATRGSLNSKFTLTADAWRITAARRTIAEVRFVKIDGAKSNIINAWIFPLAPAQTPVFAAELIGVNDVTRVAFIDIQTPALSGQAAVRVKSMTRPLAQRYATLPCDEPAPGWATCESTGNFTYARGASNADLQRISDCYFDYLDCYIDHFMESPPLATPPATDSGQMARTAAEQLHSYQLHHMEHSPGKKFLGNLFGNDWTHQFMTDFLFAETKE